MGSLFSRSCKSKKKKENQITDQDRAVLDLKNARDRLQKYQKRLNVETGDLQEKAKKLVKEKKKDRALLVLKLKRYKEKQYEKVDGQLLTVHELIETIAWETENLKVFDALKEGNKALQKIHEEMPLDEVEQLMEDTQEAMAYQEELSRLLSGGLEDGDIDEEELEKELVEFQAALDGQKASELEEQLPEAPTDVPAAPEKAPTQGSGERTEAKTAVLG